MGDLRDLYQELILDHGRNPRNHRRIEGCESGNCSQAEGVNPLCGDRLVLYLKTDGERIDDLAFQGAGCAIFTSSSSMLTEALRGKTIEEGKQLLSRFLAMLTDDSEEPGIESELGKLVVFAGVKEFPVRVKCATLAWRTLEAILEGRDEPISTE